MADLFIAIADIHSNTDMLAKILNEHKDLRAIFIAGDLTNFGHEREARRVLSFFMDMPAHVPFFFIAGNCDTKKARDEFAAHDGYLERRSSSLRLNDSTLLSVIGAGGGILHTGMTPFELKDEELESNLAAAHASCRIETESNLVVLTHTPPRDTFADLRMSRHLGSPAFESFMYEHEPLLWICGHIHEGRSARYEGRTLLVNPGPAAHGFYALISVEHVPQGVRVAADLRAV